MVVGHYNEFGMERMAPWIVRLLSSDTVALLGSDALILSLLSCIVRVLSDVAVGHYNEVGMERMAHGQVGLSSDRVAAVV